MAKGNRCYLCGGKLRRGRCVDCGLDNDRMTRRNYRLNVTTPYHVKQQQVAARKAENMKYIKEYKQEQAALENLGKPVSQQKKNTANKTINTPTKSNTGRTAYQQQARKNYEQTVRDIGSRADTRNHENPGTVKKAWIGPVIGLIFILFPLLGELGSCVADVVDEVKTPEYAFSEAEEVFSEDAFPQGAVSEDDYAWVTRELSEDGEHYDNILGPGNYIVGVHIPEGTYTAEITEGSYMYSLLRDDSNGIFISLNLGEDAYDSVLKVEDIRMYEGALLEVTGDGAIAFVSENAQTDQMFGMENPIDNNAIASFYAETSEEIEIVVGEDIPEGIYDLSASSGWSSVRVSYPVEEYDEDYFYEYHYWLDSETKEMSYKNIVLIDGMIVSFSDCELQFMPSEWIMHDDYESLFKEYYY